MIARALCVVAMVLAAGIARAQVPMQMPAPVVAPPVHFLNPVMPYGPSFKPIMVAPAPQPMPVPYQPPPHPIFQRPPEPIEARPPPERPVWQRPAQPQAPQPQAPQPQAPQPQAPQPPVWQPPPVQAPSPVEPPPRPQQPPPQQPPPSPPPVARAPVQGGPPSPPVVTPPPPVVPDCDDERIRTPECLEYRFDAAMTQGHGLLRAGRYDDALAQFKRAVLAAPYPFQRAEAFHAVGTAQIALARFEPALAAFDQDPYEGTFGRGMVYWLVGDLENAERALRNATRMPTARAVYFEQLSTVLKERGRGVEVPAIFRDAYQHDRNRDWALSRWFGALFENQRFDQIRAEYTALAPDAQSDRHVRFYFGAANVRLHRPDEGIPVLLDVVRDDADNVAAYGELAGAYAQLGDSAREREYRTEYQRRCTALAVTC